MIELIRHLLGLCPDHASHFNLFDGMLAGGFVYFSGAYTWVKVKIKNLFSWKRP